MTTRLEADALRAAIEAARAQQRLADALDWFREDAEATPRRSEHYATALHDRAAACRCGWIGVLADWNKHLADMMP